jgi:hypothetical protein
VYKQNLDKVSAISKGFRVNKLFVMQLMGNNGAVSQDFFNLRLFWPTIT